MINYAIKMCKKNNIKFIEAKYFKTKKNEVCYDFFKNNFKIKSKDLFIINTKKSIKTSNIVKIYEK